MAEAAYRLRIRDAQNANELVERLNGILTAVDRRIVGVEELPALIEEFKERVESAEASVPSATAFAQALAGLEAVRLATLAAASSAAQDRDIATGSAATAVGAAAAAATATAGKADADGSNVSAPAFRGAIGAAEETLGNLDTAEKKLVALFNIGGRDVPIESLGASQSTALATTADLATNAAAIRAAAIEARASGRPLKAELNRVYRCGPLDLSDLDGLHIVGGLTLRPVVPAGSAATRDIRLPAGLKVEADADFMLPPQTLSQNQDTVILGDRTVFLGQTRIYPEDGIQRNGQIALDGSDIEFNDFLNYAINRPLLWQAASIRDGVSPIARRKGLRIKHWTSRYALRGLRVDGVDGLIIDVIDFWERAPGATKQPGRNAILGGGAINCEIRSGRIGHTGEHGIRLADAPGYGGSDGVRIKAHFEKTGGCAIKVNGGSIEAGQKTHADDLMFEVTANDIGLGTGAGHGGSALFRISHARKVQIPSAEAWAKDYAYGAWHLAQLVDVDDFRAGRLAGGPVRQAISITQNGDWPGPTPDVLNVTVGYLDVEVDGGDPAEAASTAVINMSLTAKPEAAEPEEGDNGDPSPHGTIANFRVMGGDIRCKSASKTPRLIDWNSDAPAGEETLLGGPIEIRARLTGNFNLTSNIPASPNVVYDLDVETLAGERYHYKGRADQFVAKSNNTFVDAELNLDDVPASMWGPTVRPRGLVAGIGRLWALLTSYRAADGRRGGTVAMEQQTGNVWQLGYVFLRAAGATTNALTRLVTILWNGDLKLDVAGAGVIMKSPDSIRARRASVDNDGNFVLDGGLKAPGVPYVLAAGGAPIAHTGSTVATTLKTVVVPANSRGPNGYVEVEALWASTTALNTKNGRTRFNNTIWGNVTITTAQTNGRSYVKIQNEGGNTQSGAAGAVSFGSGGGAPLTAALNEASDWTIDFNALLADAGDNIILKQWCVRVCYLP